MAGRTLGVADAEPTLDALTVTGATTLNGNVAVGNAAADLVGFHGATAVDQYANIVSVTNSTTATLVSAVVNQILDLLKEKGLMA